MPARPIAVNIVLDEEAKSLMRTTLARLRGAGLQDALVVEALGIISGQVAPEKLADLKKVAGVRMVQETTLEPPAAAEPTPASDQRRSER